MKRSIGELTTQGGLARALGLTDRRVRQLADLHVIVPEPDGGYDLPLNQRRYRLFVDRDMDRIADDIEKAKAEVDDALGQLRNEPELERRRILAQEVGFTVGGLYRAMRLGSALAPEHAREMLETYTKMFVGRATDAFLDLCRWEIEDDPEPRAGGN